MVWAGWMLIFSFLHIFRCIVLFVPPEFSNSYLYTFLLVISLSFLRQRRSPNGWKEARIDSIV